MKTPEQLVDFVNTIEELGSTPMGKGPDVPDHLSIYTRKEMMLLAKYAVKIPKGGIAVEIGVYVGHTASILLNLEPEDELDLIVVLVDNWSWMMPDARDSFDKMIADNFSHAYFESFWMTSNEAYARYVETWGETDGHTIDFIHIDACHDRGEEGVDNDCKLWLPLLRSGGVAVFHDVDHEPVMQTVDEFCPGWEGERAGRTAVRIKP